MVSSAAMMAFFEESETHLETAETSLLELEKDVSNTESLNELFRVIHSLKGNAGLVGLIEIHEVSTEMESMLDKLRKSKDKAEQKDLDRLFVFLDKLQNLVENAGVAAENAKGKKKNDTGIKAGQESPAPEAGATDTEENSAGAEKSEPETDAPPLKAEGAPAENKGSSPPQADTTFPEIENESETDDEVLSFLTFELGKETYGIDIRSVREIILSKHLTRVPNAKDFVSGIMNLRGMVIPVIDAKKRLGFAELSVDPADGNSAEEDMNIVIVEEEGLRTGIMVDKVEDIMKFSKDMIVPSSEVLGSAELSYIYGMGKTEAKTIVLLDIKNFCGVNEHYY